MKTLASALIAAALVASPVHAGTIFSWENDAQGWNVVVPESPTPPTPLSTFSSTTGVTHGSYSAVRTIPGGWNNQFQSGYSPSIRMALTGETNLSVDLTLSTTVPSWAQFWVTAQLIIEGIPDAILTRHAVSDSTTLHWDYSAHAAAIAGATGYGHIRFITESYGGFNVGDAYFDNLRAAPIPEPASLGLLGLGGLAMLRRRRA